VALESALKYFLISAISGAFFIFGGAFLYGEAVSLDLLTISTSGPNALGVILILIGLFIKLGVAPFHVWLPDAYEGANYKTFIFIALYTKLFILFVLFLFWKVFMIENFFLIISIILCGLIGGIQALFQEKIKRFMSFTLIFNNIFFLLPLWSTNIFYLIITFIFYFFNNLLTLSLFLKYSFRNIRDLLILDPLQKIILLISLFSSIGVPPLVGFFVKTLPFYSDINKSYFLLIFIIFFVILTSWYYLRLISVLFFSEVKNKQFLEAIPAKLSLFISALTVFLVLFLILFI
jgi:NADH-quinone oxidoreductase subunit N